MGADSTIHFLAIADLGQVTLDGSDEYDYDWSGDPLNEDATGTLMRVRPDTMHHTMSLKPWPSVVCLTRCFDAACSPCMTDMSVVRHQGLSAGSVSPCCRWLDHCCCCVQAYDTLTQVIYDNEAEQGARSAVYVQACQHPICTAS